MKSYKLFLLLLCAFSCTDEKHQEQKATFDSLAFSFDGNSMKFTQLDTIFMRRRNALPNQLSYTKIDKKTNVIINEFVDSINSKIYDTTYIEHHLHDDSEYKFYITKGKVSTSIYIYGQKGPRELYHFANWLMHLQHQHDFQTIDANVNFGNLHRVVLPPPIQPSGLDY